MIKINTPEIWVKPKLKLKLKLRSWLLALWATFGFYLLANNYGCSAGVLVEPSQYGRGHGGASADEDAGQIGGFTSGELSRRRSRTRSQRIFGNAEAATEAEQERVGGSRLAEEHVESGLGTWLTTSLFLNDVVFIVVKDGELQEGRVGQRRTESHAVVSR